MIALRLVLIGLLTLNASAFVAALVLGAPQAAADFATGGIAAGVLLGLLALAEELLAR